MRSLVHKDWWKTIFDELYLVTDARSVCNPALTAGEVDLIIEVLGLCPEKNKHTPILDLCGGQGRHSLELCKRGYSNLFVLDYSPCLLKAGKKEAEENKLDLFFLRGDARKTCFGDGFFPYILVMGSSFGYFLQEEENLSFLQEVKRILAPGGRFFLDIPDRNFILENFKEESVHFPDEDLIVERKRKIQSEKGGEMILSREKVISRSHGNIRETVYSTRLYTRSDITRLLYQSGFSTIRFLQDFVSRGNCTDYGFMSRRMAVVAS